MSSPVQTPKQASITLPFDGHPLTVRRMYNRPAREFLKLLAKEVVAAKEVFFGDQSDKQAQTEKFLGKITELIASVDSLADFLLKNSTDHTPEQLDQLDFDEWLQALAAALKLNCGDELKNSFAGIADALAPLLAEMTTKTSNGESSTPS
ncbi:MAG: hypothetical protein HY302_10575 [Opitutae bacterium]|nr:hypothetical protein [Opitutae bacterium]